MSDLTKTPLVSNRRVPEFILAADPSVVDYIYQPSKKTAAFLLEKAARQKLSVRELQSLPYS